MSDQKRRNASAVDRHTGPFDQPDGLSDRSTRPSNRTCHPSNAIEGATEAGASFLHAFFGVTLRFIFWMPPFRFRARAAGAGAETVAAHFRRRRIRSGTRGVPRAR